MHGIHHSKGITFGGLGKARVSRSRVGSLRSRLRGVASGCITGVSGVMRTGSGRVVAIWVRGRRD